VPDFFFSEITNILWKHIQRGELSLEKAQQNLAIIRQINLKVIPSYDLVIQALNLSAQLKQAVYDCVYLALAIEYDCLMITADERFINAVKQNSAVDSILWLKDFKE